MHRRAGAGDHGDAVLLAESHGHGGIAIAAHGDLRVRPGLGHEAAQARAIRLGGAAGEVGADVGDVPAAGRRKGCRSACVRDQLEVRGGQFTFALDDWRQFTLAGSKDPLGLGAAAFDSEHALCFGDISYRQSCS